MTEAPDREELFSRVREGRVPATARERVRARLIPSAPRRRLGPLVPLLVGAATATIAFWLAQRPRGADVVEANDVEGAVAGEAVTGRLRVRDRGHVHLSLRAAQVRAYGPAVLEVRDDGVLVVDRGAATVEGQVRVSGAGGACVVDIDGRCALHGSPESMQVHVFAGTVERLHPSTACAIEDLEATVVAARPAPPPRIATAATTPTSLTPEPTAPAGAAQPSLDARRARDPEDDLAAQIAAYRAAAARRGSDDAGALASWRSLRRRWPRSALRHEVDVSIVETLLRLGREEEARREARSFVRRHPSSPRLARMRALATPDR